MFDLSQEVICESDHSMMVKKGNSPWACRLWNNITHGTKFQTQEQWV